MVARGFDTQLFGCQIADGFPVHRVVHGLGRRHNSNTALLIFVESFRANGFDLTDNDVRSMFFDGTI